MSKRRLPPREGKIKSLTRRGLIGAAIAGSGVAPLAAQWGWLGAGGDSEPLRRMRMLLIDIFGGQASPRAIGEAYLRLYPGERDHRRILGGFGASADPQSFARELSERRAREFRDGDTVLVDGWVLARSEARLCALTVLL